MNNDDHYSNEAINARAVEKQREEFSDLQNEMAGRETGKTTRFISDEERKKRSGQDTRSEATRTQLQLAMMNPQYAALHNDVSQSIGDTQNLIYQEMIENSERLSETQKALDEGIDQNLGDKEIERRRKDHEHAQERQRRLEAWDAELSDYQAQVNDPDNPISMEELGTLKTRVTQITNEAVSSENNAENVTRNPSKEVTPELDLSGFGPAPS